MIITEISAAKSHQDFFDHKMIFFPNQKQHHLLAQGYEVSFVQSLLTDHSN